MKINIFAILLSTFVLIVSSDPTSSIVWQDISPNIREASGCDLPWKDFHREYNISLEECRSKCEFQKLKDFQCTHYVWNPESLGNHTCFFKHGEVSEKSAKTWWKKTVKCGILTTKPKFLDAMNWKEFPPSLRESSDCTFRTKNILYMESISLEDCRTNCQFQTHGPNKCTNYMWNPNIESGTCSYNVGNVSEKTAQPDPGVKCGFLAISWKYFEDDDVWWSYNCKFVAGTELIRLPAQSSQGCGGICKRTPECTHFNVNFINSVPTCYLKSGGASKGDAVLDLIDLDRKSTCGVRHQQTIVLQTEPTNTIDDEGLADHCECVC